MDMLSLCALILCLLQTVFYFNKVPDVH